MTKLISILFLLVTFGFSTPLVNDSSITFKDIINSTDTIKYIEHREADLSSPAFFWNYATNTNQIKLIVQYIILGNGAINISRNQDTLISSMIDVRHCVNKNVDSISKKFNYDVDVFSAITACAYKESWL